MSERLGMEEERRCDVTSSCFTVIGSSSVKSSWLCVTELKPDVAVDELERRESLDSDLFTSPSAREGPAKSSETCSCCSLC